MKTATPRSNYFQVTILNAINSPARASHAQNELPLAAGACGTERQVLQCEVSNTEPSNFQHPLPIVLGNSPKPKAAFPV